MGVGKVLLSVKEPALFWGWAEWTIGKIKHLPTNQVMRNLLCTLLLNNTEIRRVIVASTLNCICYFVKQKKKSVTNIGSCDVDSAPTWNLNAGGQRPKCFWGDSAHTHMFWGVLYLKHEGHEITDWAYDPWRGFKVVLSSWRCHSNIIIWTITNATSSLCLLWTVGRDQKCCTKYLVYILLIRRDFNCLHSTVIVVMLILKTFIP